MELVWLGHSCFRFKGREATLITDPFDESIGYSLSKVTADMVTVSHPHPGHSRVQVVGGNPKVIEGPGEYEIANIFITGIRTYHDEEQGKLLGKNTVYLIEMDGLVTCHLGDLGHIPTPSQVEVMGDVDILLVPIGGATTINAAKAAEVISLVEPKVVIPMHYRVGKLSPKLDTLDKFCREMGLTDYKPLNKLNLHRNNLPEEAQIVILEPRPGA